MQTLASEALASAGREAPVSIDFHVPSPITGAFPFPFPFCTPLPAPSAPAAASTVLLSATPRATTDGEEEEEEEGDEEDEGNAGGDGDARVPGDGVGVMTRMCTVDVGEALIRLVASFFVRPAFTTGRREPEQAPFN